MIVRTKSDEQFLKDGGVWSDEAGDKVIRFVESFLVLEDGQPFRLTDWQKADIRQVYCWLKPDGTRRVKVALWTLGRKNGKSALTFALAAYHLIADGEQSPSCVSCACTKEQASQIYEWFRFAVELNPKLSSALRCTASKKTIHYPKRNGYYRSLASEANANFGHGHSFVIYDELAFHKKDDLYIALKNSTDARPNGLQVITSTAGWNKNGAFYKLVSYSRKILSGEVIDTTFMPFVYEIPEGAEDDEQNWHLANPSLGITQTIEDFRHQWARERQDATSKLAFKRLKFNQWTDSEASWIAPETWDACVGNATIPDGAEVHIGIDIGATRDLTAISLVAPQPDKTYRIKSWGFVPEAALKLRDGVNTVVYQSCAKFGDLRLTKGNATDEREIIKFLDELRQRYKVLSITFDKWQSLVLSNDCQAKGLTVYGFPQTCSYFNAPCLELEKLVNQRRLTHDGSPLLRWQIGHTYLDRDSKGYVKPTTSRPENKKDNLISLLMALSQALQAGTTQARPSVYETRGLFVLGTR